MLPTEENVKTFIKLFKETPKYKRKYLVNPFKCNNQYYKAFKNSRVSEYICKEFIKGTCWHRSCRKLHDIQLYRKCELAKDVFGDVQINGAVHDPHRTLLLTFFQQKNDIVNVITFQESQLQKDTTGLTQESLNTALTNAFEVRGIEVIKKWRQSKFLIQFTSIEHAMIALRMFDGKSFQINGQTYKIAAERSKADII